MKNWERFEKEIREIGVDRLALVNGVPCECCTVNCSECQLPTDECEESTYDWLYQDVTIRVGDVVRYTGTYKSGDLLLYVTHTDGMYLSGLSISENSFGETIERYNIRHFKPTDKHVPLEDIIKLIEM